MLIGVHKRERLHSKDQNGPAILIPGFAIWFYGTQRGKKRKGENMRWKRGEALSGVVFFKFFDDCVYSHEDVHSP